ncbi:uncharacterized protein LOC103316570 isoform X1 [Nasonia vitripennis]|uniref:Uncharacterized protein n=1 Tax=Nasonia vitripennis TaxID=7425 RepID=A0A7M7HBQ9_NASVI|nr:uncharacterized protein LOC103316570 isoform X1 [Nasonia vitripennis]
MDFRGTKVFDFVSATRNLTENARKDKFARIEWHRDYRWLCDKYVELGRKLNDLCDEKRSYETHSTAGREDKRTCLPFPETTNQQYGWLSRRPDFQLENYGSYIVKYPNPMDEIVLLEGDVPTLAVGKGFLL